MKVIYENTIKDMGECAEEFREEKMIVIFGDSAPEEIKDFCYWVDVAPINGGPAERPTPFNIGGQSHENNL